MAYRTSSRRIAKSARRAASKPRARSVKNVTIKL